MASLLAWYTNVHWTQKAWHNTKDNFIELKRCKITFSLSFYKIVQKIRQVSLRSLELLYSLL